MQRGELRSAAMRFLERFGFGGLSRVFRTDPVETNTVEPKKAAVVVQEAAPNPSLLAPSAVRPGATRAIDLQAKALAEMDPLSSVVDGIEHCRAVLAQIRAIRRQDPSRRCVVVFDLDNTLFETRQRTFLALKAYDAAKGTTHFSSLLDHTSIGRDGKHTAELLGLPPDEIASVHEHWLEWFWRGENFLHDLIVEPVFDLAWQAKAAGAEVLYLTGRINHASTLVQLERAGLPDAHPEHLFCKQSGEDTGAFKAKHLSSWMERGDFVGWFLTEGCRDIAALQKVDERFPCVRLGYVHETDTTGVRPDTPLLPEEWSRKLRALPEEKT